MKHTNKVKRLQARIKDYEQLIARDSNAAKSMRKPGSLRR